MTGAEMAQCDVPDKLVMFSYLTQIYQAFKGEIPYVKYAKLVSNFNDKKNLFFYKKIFKNHMFIRKYIMNLIEHFFYPNRNKKRKNVLHIRSN